MKKPAARLILGEGELPAVAEQGARGYVVGFFYPVCDQEGRGLLIPDCFPEVSSGELPFASAEDALSVAQKFAEKTAGNCRGVSVFDQEFGLFGLPGVATAAQCAPIRTSERDVQGLVIGDLVERRELGMRRYGTPLQAANGRDALEDAYQEALDLACYLRQGICERDTDGLAVAINRLSAVCRQAAERWWRGEGVCPPR